MADLLHLRLTLPAVHFALLCIAARFLAAHCCLVDARAGCGLHLALPVGLHLRSAFTAHRLHQAVIDALHETHGVDHIDMPCTPARVWAAMQGRPEPPQ